MLQTPRFIEYRRAAIEANEIFTGTMKLKRQALEAERLDRIRAFEEANKEKLKLLLNLIMHDARMGKGFAYIEFEKEAESDDYRCCCFSINLDDLCHLYDFLNEVGFDADFSAKGEHGLSAKALEKYCRHEKEIILNISWSQ